MKQTPSILTQTPWKAGFFHFGKAEFPRSAYFNCGLVSRPDGNWLAVRRAVFDRAVRVGKNDIVAFKLDDKIPLHGIRVKLTKTFEGEHYEDPRAIYHKGITYVSCTDFVWSSKGWSGAHQIIEAVNNNWESIKRFDPVYGRNGAGIGQNSGQEKNWLWFFHNDEPHLVYNGRPHIVARFSHDFRHREDYKTDNKHPWRWGEIRGGTPPVLVNGEYWTFFHSSTPWHPPYRQYHMGAYAFQAEPPFAITKMTHKPLLSGSDQDKWAQGKPIVVFPCGATYRNNQWFVTGGCNDLCCFWIEIPHEGLLEYTQPRSAPMRFLERVMS